MGEGLFEYVYTLVRLLNKAGHPNTVIGADSGVSYGKLRDITSRSSERISIDTIKKIEAYALRVAEEE